jgi:1,4-dihydroxy-2-naphthoate polyprenyltransferase
VSFEILNLKYDPYELESILLNGSLLRQGEPWIAIPRDVVRNPTGVESVVFEVVRPQDLDRPSPFQIVLKAIRPYYFTLTLVPALTVYLYGSLKGWALVRTDAILALLGVLCLQVSVNTFNDVENHLQYQNQTSSWDKRGVIQKGWMSARSLRRLGFGTLILGNLLGIPAVIESLGELFWIGVCATLGVISYSIRSFNMKYRLLGDFALFVLLGPMLALGLCQAAFRHWDFGIVVIGATFGFLAWAIHQAHHLYHFEEHRKRIENLSVVRIGFRLSRHGFAALYVFAYAVLTVGVLLHLLPIYPVLISSIALFWIVPVMNRTYKASGPASAFLSLIYPEAIKIHFIFGLLVSFGFLLSRS